MTSSARRLRNRTTGLRIGLERPSTTLRSRLGGASMLSEPRREPGRATLPISPLQSHRQPDRAVGNIEFDHIAIPDEADSGRPSAAASAGLFKTVLRSRYRTVFAAAMDAGGLHGLGAG